MLHINQCASSFLIYSFDFKIIFGLPKHPIFKVSWIREVARCTHYSWFSTAIYLDSDIAIRYSVRIEFIDTSCPIWQRSHTLLFGQQFSPSERTAFHGCNVTKVETQRIWYKMHVVIYFQNWNAFNAAAITYGYYTLIHIHTHISVAS